MYGSAIPDGLHDFRCDKHCLSAYSISGYILLYIVLHYSWCSVIPLRIFTKILRRLLTIELHFRGSRVIQESGDRVYVPYSYNTYYTIRMLQMILVFLNLQFGSIWNQADTKKLLHLASSRQSGIVEPFRHQIFFC